MLIPNVVHVVLGAVASLSRGVNANSQLAVVRGGGDGKSIKRGEC